MTGVDTTHPGQHPGQHPGPAGRLDVGARLAELERLIARWDFTAAQAAARDLLDEPDLSPDDRLTARRLLAEALRELGDLDAAYDLAEAAVAQAEQAYGPADPATVHALAVLAVVRHDYDEWDAAEALYHRVLDSGVDELGDASVCRAVRLARVNLALLQRDRGDRALALTMLNAAYVVHRREYGADDLDTIRIAAELAALHHADGNVNASRRLFTLAHAAARSRLGTRHAFTRAVEWELAAVEPPMPAALAPVDQDATDVAAPVSPAPVSAPPVSSPSAPPAVLAPLPVPMPEVSSPEVSPPEPDVARVERRFVVPLQAVAAIVVLALVLAGVSILRDERAAGPARAHATQTAGATNPAATEPPSPAVEADRVRDLTLRDQGTSLAVSWTGLQAPVVVALSRAGAPAVVLASVPPGTSEFLVRGIEPGVAYCVVVGAVDAAVAMTPATSVCTGER